MCERALLYVIVRAVLYYVMDETINIYKLKLKLFVQSAEEVTRVVNETWQVIGHGAFKLTKFAIEDNQLLKTIDVNRTIEVRSVVPDMCCRPLGIQWHLNDSFHYDNKRGQIDDATTNMRRHI